MNSSNEAAQSGFGTEPLRIPPPPPPGPTERKLHLVAPPQTLEPSAESAVAAPARTTAQPEPQSVQGPTPTSGNRTVAEADPSLALTTRRLERELAEVQEEVEALQEMLQELPTIFERKFRQSLSKVLDQQHRLEADNNGLRRKLLAIAPGSDLDSLPRRPHGLLPPALRTALKLRQQEALEPIFSGGVEPTTAGSEDPTHR
jgi:hypothetical protein